MVNRRGDFAMVEVLTDSAGGPITHPTLWLAPTAADIVTVADGSEIVQCV